MSDPATVGAGAPETVRAVGARSGAAPDDPGDLAAARRGDSVAFARIYDRHAGVVLSICRRYAGAGMHDFAEAEDALQETFVRAFRLLDSLEDPQRLRAWLFGIARRVCAERRRGESRRRRREAHAMTAARLDDPRAGGDGAIGAERSEALRRLDTALEALPDDERLAIHLYYLDPDPVVAAKEALHLSRSAFYKLLARAKARLARLMEDVR